MSLLGLPLVAGYLLSPSLFPSERASLQSEALGGGGAALPGREVPERGGLGGRGAGGPSFFLVGGRSRAKLPFEVWAANSTSRKTNTLIPILGDHSEPPEIIPDFPDSLTPTVIMCPCSLLLSKEKGEERSRERESLVSMSFSPLKREVQGQGVREEGAGPRRLGRPKSSLPRAKSGPSQISELRRWGSYNSYTIVALFLRMFGVVESGSSALRCRFRGVGAGRAGSGDVP